MVAEEGRGCLSVVMPCYNEAATIVTAATRALASPFTAELIIVDDGSIDRTLELARELTDPRVRVLAQPTNQGKGAALRRGFEHATARFVIVQDADLEYDPADFGLVLAPLLDGRADVVYGSRFHANRPHRVLYYWHAVGNRILTTASNMFTNLNLSDMETCYKAFRREVIQTLAIEEDRFGFEPEITAKVARGGWRIWEVGISYAGRTYDEGKKIGWKDGVRALHCILKYSPLREAARQRLSGRIRVPPRPVQFAEADEELAATLESLDGAERYADWIYGLIEPHVGEHVLEIGAGHGTFTKRLAARSHVVATELSPQCVNVLQGRFSGDPRVEVRKADLAESVSGGDYDSVVLINVLEHIEDHAAAVRQLASAVKAGGRVVLWVPAFAELYSDFDRRIGHYRRYRLPELRQLLADGGLTVVEARYVNALGAIGWWVIAKRLRRRPTIGVGVRIFDTFAVGALRWVETRWPPPFGQSICCVAVRP